MIFSHIKMPTVRRYLGTQKVDGKDCALFEEDNKVVAKPIMIVDEAPKYRQETWDEMYKYFCKQKRRGIEL